MYLIKKAQKPFSPFEKAWKILLFFSLWVQHVIKELCPQLGAKTMKRQKSTKENLDLPPPLEVVLYHPLVLHSAHLSFQMIFHSKCRRLNSPQYIFRKEDNKQNPQCQNNRDGTFPDK